MPFCLEMFSIKKLLVAIKEKDIALKSAKRLSENGYLPQSLRQTQIIILEILQCMDACPAVFKRGGYNFRLP